MMEGERTGMWNFISAVGGIVATISMIYWRVAFKNKSDPTKTLIFMWIGIAVMWAGRALS